MLWLSPPNGASALDHSYKTSETLFHRDSAMEERSCADSKHEKRS